GIRVFHVTGVQTCALPISRKAMTRPRARRAYRGHQTAAMAMVELTRLGPRAAARAMARISTGKERTRSLTRMRASSSQPPTKPRSEERRVGKEGRDRWGAE